MMKTDYRVTRAAWLLACLFLAACSRPGSTPGDGSSSGSKRRIAFVTNNASDFWTIARRGTEKAGSELPNVDIEFRIDTDGTAAEQRRIVDDLLTKGVAGFAISPVDPANQTQMINDAVQKSVVITQDSDAAQSNRALYIGTDNRAAGKQAGEMIQEALPQGGKIMLFVGKLDAQNAQERMQGIKDVLAGSKVEIVDVRTDDTDQVRAKANAADAIVKHPEVGALVGLWAYNGPAILNAIKEAGKIGKIQIVCFDEDDQTLAGIKDGAIHATIVQQPYEFGYQAIILINKLLDGDRSVIPETKQKFVPTVIIKRDNVDDFIVKINKLKGRS
jgi:ribose transport system substrate-binding protein